MFFLDLFVSFSRLLFLVGSRGRKADQLVGCSTPVRHDQYATPVFLLFSPTIVYISPTGSLSHALCIALYKVISAHSQLLQSVQQPQSAGVTLRFAFAVHCATLRWVTLLWLPGSFVRWFVRWFVGSSFQSGLSVAMLVPPAIPLSPSYPHSLPISTLLFYRASLHTFLRVPARQSLT